MVALLPIKAHSERIPAKNFRNFAGKPLFYWILESLLQIAEIEFILINTDAVDLLSQHPVINHPKVRLLNRPSHLRGDHMSMNAIIAHDLETVGEEFFLMTHVTNPLLRPSTIQHAIKTFFSGRIEGRDSLFSVNRLQSRLYDHSGRPLNHDPDNLIRTQDLEPIYEENSNLYVFSKESFRQTGSRIGRTPELFPTPFLESADIDDPVGWHVAELIALSQLIGRASEQFRGWSDQ